MKKTLVILVLIIFCVSIGAYETEKTIYALAERIAGEMGKEAFVVKVLYGETLLNNGVVEGKRKKPTESDIRAAAAAYGNFGFSGGALNCLRWRKVKNTPLEMRSGVQIYEWYFYI